ncbi:MAG: hypothetical protein ACRCZI_15735 [Cetobacterium sp.]
MSETASDSPQTLPIVDPLPDIVHRYLNGESLALIASEQGKSLRTLYNWLLSDKGQAYDELITECLTNRVADADSDLMCAMDKVQIARARETAKFARMDFERRRPKLYGPKQEIATDNRITVIVQRERPQPTQINPVSHNQHSVTSQYVNMDEVKQLDSEDKS